MLPLFARRSLPLVKRDGEWKLDAFVGAHRARAQPPPPLGVRRFEVGRHDRPCPPVRYRPSKGLDGGCKIELEAPALAVRVLTPAGPLPFATCEAVLAAHVDRRGRMSIGPVSFSRPGGCSDLVPCGRGDGARWDSSRLPWSGRLDRAPGGDGLAATISVCLDTCFGRFVGRARMLASTGGRRWRWDPARSATGIDVLGEWTARGADLTLASARARGGGAPQEGTRG